MTTVPLRWRKASRSGTGTNCVELAHTMRVVRDSKSQAGPALAFGDDAALRALVARLRG